MPFAGGPPRRISNDQAPARKFKYYLHGVSPDGKTLAYAGAELAGDDEWGRVNLYTIPAAGGADTRLTNAAVPYDGPEYSPDGKWIYFNSELNAKVPGHSQCYRMAPDGSGIEQLTHDERVNWFPHISPDGKWIVYISFPPGTEKHPADKEVILRRMKPRRQPAGGHFYPSTAGKARSMSNKLVAGQPALCFCDVCGGSESSVYGIWQLKPPEAGR